MFVVCEKWVETRTDCYIDPSSSLDHSSTFASWLGLLNRGSLRAQNPLSAAGSHSGILSPTDTNCPGIWLPVSAVLPLIYTGVSLDWGSIYNDMKAISVIMIDCLVDFNDISTCQGLFYAKKLGNHIHIYILCSCFLLFFADGHIKLE